MAVEPGAENTAKSTETKASGLLNVRQVAKILNYSRGWVEEAVLDGRIKATKVGGQYRITPEEVKRVMESGVLPGKGKKKPAPATQLPAEKSQSLQSPAIVPAAAPVGVPKPEAKLAPAVNPGPSKQEEKPKKEGWSIFGAFK